ncbi:MAG TPA: OmpA family protein, partial [Candidatus Paceibacterota bacterium]|nr:OmpA family protein [Candidatus Paceibacterota bacterium]
DEANNKITAIQSALEEKDARIQELEKESQKATQAQKDLEQEMRQALQSKDITISELKGKLTVDILDRILFDSGEAVLKPEGMKILTQVAEVLAQFPNRQIHVIGHTDNVPIRASAMNRYPSNWELSTARATAAVRYLCEHAAVDPRRLGAVGYGEFHPIADNATAEGRAKNRRIAIVVLSEELVGSDAAKPVSSTGDSTPAQSPPAGSDSPASPEAQPQGMPPASTHDTNTPTATNRVSMPEGSL